MGAQGSKLQCASAAWAVVFSSLLGGELKCGGIGLGLGSWLMFTCTTLFQNSGAPVFLFSKKLFDLDANFMRV